MKNLKKVLALVLALSTIFGLGISASATYTDAKDIEYTEAVDVMSAIGVLGGNPDGSFAPQKNLTRAQAAKMVSFIMNGGKDVNELYAGANSFTDCYSSWAKGYIAFAQQAGVIAGVGNGKFNPDGTLTGVALAKMMLVSLGYNATVEKYQADDNWALNIINDATDAGLLEGLSASNLYTAITREQASQMMFNALKATMVEYKSGTGTSIDLGNGIIINTGSVPASDVENKKTSYTTTSDNLMQLCEKYFADLKLTDAKSDDFGRPANTWQYKNKPVGTYANTEAVLTYTTAVTKNDIAKDLGLKASELTLNKIVDGYTNGTYTDKIGGNGVLVEVYKTDTDKTYNVVTVNTYVHKLVKGDITAAKGDNAAYITLDGVKYETDAFKAGDVVLYTKKLNDAGNKAEKIVDVALATSETVVPTRVNGDGSFVANGNTYNMTAGATTISSDAVKNKSEVVVYFDSYGNVIMTEAPEASATALNYAYVVNAATDSSDIWGTGKYMAQLLLTDGTVTTVEVSANAADLKGKAVTYTVKDNKYILADATELAVGTDSKLDINKGVAEGKVNDKKVYFSSKTIFVVISKDSNGKDVYNAYTGINNVPSLEGDTSNTVAVALKSNGAEKPAAEAADGKIAEVVFVKYAKATGTTTSKDTYFILYNKDAGKITDVELGEYYEYAAVVNGEITTVKTSTKLDANKFVASVTMNDKGIITAFGADVTSASGTKTVAADAGLIGLGGTYKTYAEDCAVYFIKDGAITSGSISEITNDDNDTVVYTEKDGVVNAIYVTVVAD